MELSPSCRPPPRDCRGRSTWRRHRRLPRPCAGLPARPPLRLRGRRSRCGPGHCRREGGLASPMSTRPPGRCKAGQLRGSPAIGPGRTTTWRKRVQQPPILRRIYPALRAWTAPAPRLRRAGLSRREDRRAGPGARVAADRSPEPARGPAGGTRWRWSEPATRPRSPPAEATRWPRRRQIRLQAGTAGPPRRATGRRRPALGPPRRGAPGGARGAGRRRSASRMRSWRKRSFSPASSTIRAAQRLRQDRREVQGCAAGDRDQIGDVEGRAEDRRGPEGLQRHVAQAAEPPKDGQSEWGRKGDVGHVGLAVVGRDRPLLHEGGDQLGDEQRVSRSTGDPMEEPRSRLLTEVTAQELGHIVRAQRGDDDVASSVAHGGIDDAVEHRAPRQRPICADDADRQRRQAYGDGAQGQQRGVIGPLQVVQGENDRAADGGLLEQLNECIDDLELRTGALGGVGWRLIPVREQAADRGPPRIRRPRQAAQRLSDGGERSGRMEFVGLALKDDQAFAGGRQESLGDEPRFPDPRLTLDESELTPARGDFVDDSSQRRQLVRPPDDWCCQRRHRVDRAKLRRLVAYRRTGMPSLSGPLFAPTDRRAVPQGPFRRRPPPMAMGRSAGAKPMPQSPTSTGNEPSPPICGRWQPTGGS